MKETPIDAKRPLVQRLMPVTWVALAIVGLFAVLAGCTVARDQRIAQENATIATQEAVAAARVTATPQPSATAVVAAVSTATPQPVREQTPTPTPVSAVTPALDGTAAFFATLAPQQTRAVAEATAASAATQAIATFTPAPPTPTIFPEGYRPPWADKMVQQPDGTWMAPPEVVEQARQHYQEFYDFLSDGGREQLGPMEIAEQISIVSKYIAGAQLVEWFEFYSKTNAIWTENDGAVVKVLRIHSFNRDGLIAKADLYIDDKGWVAYRKSDRVIVATLVPYRRIDTDTLVFDPAAGRWKYSDVVIQTRQEK
jgi:hypothetical protein